MLNTGFLLIQRVHRNEWTFPLIMGVLAAISESTGDRDTVVSCAKRHANRRLKENAFECSNNVMALSHLTRTKEAIERVLNTMVVDKLTAQSDTAQEYWNTDIITTVKVSSTARDDLALMSALNDMVKVFDTTRYHLALMSALVESIEKLDTQFHGQLPDQSDTINKLCRSLSSILYIFNTDAMYACAYEEEIVTHSEVVYKATDRVLGSLVLCSDDDVFYPKDAIKALLELRFPRNLTTFGDIVDMGDFATKLGKEDVATEP
jgi:hypothetical protein